jgi:hypothetical protein
MALQMQTPLVRKCLVLYSTRSSTHLHKPLQYEIRCAYDSQLKKKEGEIP